MNENTNILIVGAGAQGAPCAAVLARQPGVGRILLGTQKLADAASVRDRLGSPKVAAAEFDARQPDATARSVRESLGKVDVVIDLTPSFISVNVMKATPGLGRPLCEHGRVPRAPCPIDPGSTPRSGRPVRRRRTSALLGCGASPGVVNIICRRFCDELDTVERIEIRAGFHIPAQKEMIKTWTPTWCPEQQYFDYCDPPCLFHDGRHEHMPLFHEPET